MGLLCLSKKIIPVANVCSSATEHHWKDSLVEAARRASLDGKTDHTHRLRPLQQLRTD